MKVRTNTLLVIVYLAIALVVVLLFALTNNQRRKTEQLLANLEQQTREAEKQRIAGNQKQPRRSLKPALFRLEQLLDERTKIVREQQSQLRHQISGREKLQQKYEKLTTAYKQLLNEHQLLASEVEFYINAAAVASGVDLNPTDGEANRATVSDELTSTELNEFRLSDEEEIDLQQQLADLNQTSRDAVIADYASQAMVEMGASAVPLVASVLSDESSDIRIWAAWILGEIGADASVAVPELQALVSDEDDEVASAAASALEKIGSP